MISGIIFGVLSGIVFIGMTIVCLPTLINLEGDKQKTFARRKLKWFCEVVLKIARADVEVIYLDKDSIENLDKREGIVVVGNHQSNLDIPVVNAKLPFDVGFVAKEEMASWPIYSFWMRRSNSIFLNRSNPREGIKSIKRAVEVIRAGYPTVIFPEGARSLDGNIHEFKKGSFRLVTDTNGIVVPVSIKGTYEIQRRGSIKVAFGRKVKLIIGKPLYVEHMSKEEKKDLSKEVERIVKENYERY